MASDVSPAILTAQAADCRTCRYSRAAVRAAAFIASGIAVSLIVAWAVSVAPWLGVLLGLRSTAAFARALLMVFFTASLIRTAYVPMFVRRLRSPTPAASMFWRPSRAHRE